MMSKTVTWRCELCGQEFEGDLWQPDYPDSDCPYRRSGQHQYYADESK